MKVVAEKHSRFMIQRAWAAPEFGKLLSDTPKAGSSELALHEGQDAPQGGTSRSVTKCRNEGDENDERCRRSVDVTDAGLVVPTGRTLRPAEDKAADAATNERCEDSDGSRKIGRVAGAPSRTHVRHTPRCAKDCESGHVAQDVCTVGIDERV